MKRRRPNERREFTVDGMKYQRLNQIILNCCNGNRDQIDTMQSKVMLLLLLLHREHI